MVTSALSILQAMSVIQETPFPILLKTLLEEARGTKGDLYNYLQDQDYPIEKTSLYRYFNAKKGVSRLPDDTFLRLFAAYTGISSEQEIALLTLWQLKRTQRKLKLIA